MANQAQEGISSESREEISTLDTCVDLGLEIIGFFAFRDYEWTRWIMSGRAILQQYKHEPTARPSDEPAHQL